MRYIYCILSHSVHYLTLLKVKINNELFLFTVVIQIFKKTYFLMSERRKKTLTCLIKFSINCTNHGHWKEHKTARLPIIIEALDLGSRESATFRSWIFLDKMQFEYLRYNFNYNTPCACFVTKSCLI